MKSAAFPLALLAVGAVLLGISAIHPYDMATWWMEVFPIFIAVPILFFTHARFPLTRLVYTLIFVHACILMLGGHYTYAQVPLGLGAGAFQALGDMEERHGRGKIPGQPAASSASGFSACFA